jgi:uncharacterized protein (TIGR01777 family)
MTIRLKGDPEKPLASSRDQARQQQQSSVQQHTRATPVAAWLVSWFRMNKSLTISRVIPAPLGVVEAYLASPGGLLRLMQSQNIRRLPPRGSTLAQQFQLDQVTFDQMPHDAMGLPDPLPGPGTKATLARVTLSEGLASPREVALARRRLTRLAHDCQRLHEFALPPKKIVITGAAGLIGSALLPMLVAAGHQVTRLVRGGGGRASELPVQKAMWQPQGQGAGALDPSVLDGADVVIHLAGEPVGGARWTKARLAAIRDSRVESTKLLARAMTQVKTPPKLLLCASGIHAYGDRGDEELTERSDIGSGYLAEVVRDWEAAAQPVRDAGVRVANIRWGLVLSRQGGALREMLPLFRVGLGAIPAPGSQWWPWVSLDDAIAQALCVLAREELSGPINGVAPQSATAAEFCRALARTVDRPLLARVPRWMLAAVFGGQEEAICTSTRAVPEALRGAGFSWEHQTLGEALGWALGEAS